jgi:hypothetical protein
VILPAPDRRADVDRFIKRLIMTILSRVTAVAFASVLLMGTAMAQTQTQTPAAPAAAPPAATKSDGKPHSAASIECSKEADAKGLHGKARKKFRSECKRNASKPQ